MHAGDACLAIVLNYCSSWNFFRPHDPDCKALRANISGLFSVCAKFFEKPISAQIFQPVCCVTHAVLAGKFVFATPEVYATPAFFQTIYLLFYHCFQRFSTPEISGVTYIFSSMARSFQKEACKFCFCSELSDF